MRVHTLRGRVEAGETKRLILDDGRFNHAMVVEEFYVFPIDVIEDPVCVLAKQEEGIGTQFDAGNGNQIAWSSCCSIEFQCGLEYHHRSRTRYCTRFVYQKHLGTGCKLSRRIESKDNQ